MTQDTQGNTTQNGAESPQDGFAGWKVRKANDAAFGVCMAVYGEGGVGKTTLACSAADTHGPLVVVDAEGGTRAITHRGDIDVIDMQSWREIKKFTDDSVKAGGAFPWRTVVFDNMSEYLNLMIKHISGDDGPTQPQWGKITTEFLGFVRTWREFSRRGVNVMFIAWEDEVFDELGRVKHNLGFTPRIRRDFKGIVDIIAFMSVDEKSPDYSRIVDFSPSSRTAAKFRRSQAESAQSIPYRIGYTLQNLPMSDILTTLHGGQNWPKDKYSEPATQRTFTKRSNTND